MIFLPTIFGVSRWLALLNVVKKVLHTNRSSCKNFDGHTSPRPFSTHVFIMTKGIQRHIILLPTSLGCLCFHIELKVQKQTKSKGCMLSFVLSRYWTFLICTRPLIKGLNNVWIPYLQVTGGTRQVLFYWELCINYPPWTRESWYFSANPGMTQSWLRCDFDDILAKVTLRSRCLVEYVHCVQTADKAPEFEVLGFPCKLSTVLPSEQVQLKPPHILSIPSQHHIIIHFIKSDW